MGKKLRKMVRYITGWWLTYPSEQYEFVSWDDEIPNIWNINENIPNVPNHQPAYKAYKCIIPDIHHGFSWFLKGCLILGWD